MLFDYHLNAIFSHLLPPAYWLSDDISQDILTIDLIMLFSVIIKVLSPISLNTLRQNSSFQFHTIPRILVTNMMRLFICFYKNPLRIINLPFKI